MHLADGVVEAIKALFFFGLIKLAQNTCVLFGDHSAWLRTRLLDLTALSMLGDVDILACVLDDALASAELSRCKPLQHF